MFFIYGLGGTKRTYSTYDNVTHCPACFGGDCVFSNQIIKKICDGKLAFQFELFATLVITRFVNCLTPTLAIARSIYSTFSKLFLPHCTEPYIAITFGKAFTVL